MKAYTLVGVDGNAFSIMGYVRSAMKRAKMTSQDIDAYTKDATSSDYDHLLVVSCKMIDKVNEVLDLDKYDENEYDENEYDEDEDYEDEDY